MLPAVAEARARQEEARRQEADRAAAEQAASDRAYRQKLEHVAMNAQALSDHIRAIKAVTSRFGPLVHYTGRWPCVDRTRAGRPGEHWSAGLRMRGGVQAWTYPRTPSTNSKPDQRVAYLLQRLEGEEVRLKTALHRLEQEKDKRRRQGMGVVTHSETNPLVWLLLGVTAGYFVFDRVLA